MRCISSLRILFAAAFVLVLLKTDSTYTFAAPVPGGKENYQKALAALDQKTAALREGLKELNWPADTPQAIGKLLKGNPDACTAFVRRAVRFEPYAGVLRGPQGTLDAGGGNSADQALLLREMIRAGASAAPPMRFVIVELPVDRATKLVEEALFAPPARQAIAASAPPAGGARHMDAPSSPIASDGGAIWKTLVDASSDLQQITALNQQMIDEQALRSAAVADTRMHVLLQVQRDGKWLTLDPTFKLPAAVDGAKFADELPPEMYHTARLIVEAERLEAGKLLRETLLDQQWPASSLHGQPIDLLVLPADFSFENFFDGKGSGADMLERSKQFKQFQTMLMVGDAPPIAGRPFDLSGKSGAAPTASSPLGGGTVDPFRRTGRGTLRPPSSELTGLWLTITLHSPSGRERKITRALLDRIGPASRGAEKTELSSDEKDLAHVRLLLVQRRQILIAGAPISADRVAHDMLQKIADKGILAQALAMKYRQDNGKPSQLLANLALPQWSPDLIGTLNDVLRLTQAQIAGAGIAFFAEPNVYLRSDGFVLRDKNNVAFRSVVDIAQNGIRLVGEANACRQARALHGLWASELEARVSDFAAGEAERRTHAAQILRTAASAGVALQTVRSADDLKNVEADADAKAVMAADLASGNILLAPTHPIASDSGPHTAWWRLDREGNLLAIGADGRGQAASEGEMVLTHTSIPMVKNCMKFVACFNKAVAGGRGMNDARADCLAQQIVDAVKASLDQSIQTFISSAQQKVSGGGDPKEYNELYGKVAKAYEAYEKGMKAMGDEPAEVPGLKEGQDAANAGKEVGQALGFRIYLLLTMGRDVANYASGL